MDYRAFTKIGVLNAEFILQEIACGKPGETVLLVADEYCMHTANLLSVCAKKLGMKPMIVDLTVYGIRSLQQVDYANIPCLTAAVAAADITFMMTWEYGPLLADINNNKKGDAAHTGESRVFALWGQDIHLWSFDYKKILAARERTPRLRKLLLSGKKMRITTALGTDITCDIGADNLAAHNILSLTPFYAEVATVPALGVVNGIAVCDGACQKVRDNEFGSRDLDTPPIRLVIKDSYVVDYQGEPQQIARLEKLMDSGTPRADAIDEIGIVTVMEKINDLYPYHRHFFGDGSHHSNSVHIALGNNVNDRKDMIHAPVHSDFDMYNPTVEIDGHIILTNGQYDDDYLKQFD